MEAVPCIVAQNVRQLFGAIIRYGHIPAETDNWFISNMCGKKGNRGNYLKRVIAYWYSFCMLAVCHVWTIWRHKMRLAQRVHNSKWSPFFAACQHSNSEYISSFFSWPFKSCIQHPYSPENSCVHCMSVLLQQPASPTNNTTNQTNFLPANQKRYFVSALLQLQLSLFESRLK